MSKITITEALAELKTIGKRIDKKRRAIGPYIGRQVGAKDPLEKDGGSVAYIQRELQAIKDLQERIIALRQAIADANENTGLAVSGNKRTIAEWLIWRREVLPIKKAVLNDLRGAIAGLRAEAQKRGVSLTEKETENYEDIIVNINEKQLAEEIELLETIEGELDGLLSLKNATTFVEL